MFFLPDLEEWEPVEGFSGYEVSNLGRVRSWLANSNNYTGPMRLANKPRIMKGKNEKGYRRYTLRTLQGQVFKSGHTLVLEAFVGPRPSGYQAAHYNGNRSDNRLCNLRWATPPDNMHDRIRHGTVPRGEGFSCSKLNAIQVSEIKTKLKEWKPLPPRAQAKVTLRSLAKEYNVHPNTIRSIKDGKTWREDMPKAP